jgi:uncharacterized membrane protein
MGFDRAWLTVDGTATKTLPTDLLVAGSVCLSAFLLASFGSGGPLRVLTAMALLWFLPGYVTVSALYPERDRRDARSASAELRGVSVRGRAVLAVGVSLALSIFAGLLVGTVSTEFTPEIVVNVTVAYVAIVGLIAAVRRYRLPAQDRFSLPTRAWIDEAVNAVTTGSVPDRLLTVALVCSVLLAAGTFGLAVGMEPSGQPYTDFQLLTADGDGEYVSGGYPAELNESETATYTVGIRNSEAEPIEYTVVVVLERVVNSGGDAQVIETAELNRTSVATAAGERTFRTQTVRPTLVGEDLRLGFYLYRGDVPDRVRADTSYRHLHVWVTVQSG